jgi:hypothetical protein
MDFLSQSLVYRHHPEHETEIMDNAVDYARHGSEPQIRSGSERRPAAERPLLHPILQLQRDVGNQAVLRLLRSGVFEAKKSYSKSRSRFHLTAPLTRTDRITVHSGGPTHLQRVPAAYDADEQRKLIEEGIRDKDIGKIKDVEPIAYALASDSQAIDMILILLNQGWVGPRDELAIYNIWNSRGKGVIDLASKYTAIWNMCLDRGVDTIWNIPDLIPVKAAFKQAVASRARGYLDDNKKTIEAEIKRYGLDNMGAAPTSEQGQEREKMLQAAVIIKKAKDAIGKNGSDAGRLQACRRHAAR